MGPRSEDVASVSRDEARAQEEVCLCVRALCVECEALSLSPGPRYCQIKLNSLQVPHCTLIKVKLSQIFI